MTNRVTILEDNQPGTVVLSVSGLAPSEDVKVTITRKKSDRPNLGPQGWQTTEYLFTPRVIRDGSKGATDLVFGREMTDHLDLDADIWVGVPSESHRERHFWPANMAAPGAAKLDVELPTAPVIETEGPSGTGSQDTDSESDEADDSDERDAEEEGPTKLVDPPEPKERGKRGWIIPAVLATCCLFLAGAAAYYFWPLLSETRQSEREPVPRNLTALYAQYRSEGGHAEELLSLGQEALESGQQDLGFNAITLAADRQNAAANMLIGRWYDPLETERGLLEPNANSAALYYTNAAVAGHVEAEALISRLCEAPENELTPPESQPFDRRSYCQ